MNFLCLPIPTRRETRQSIGAKKLHNGRLPTPCRKTPSVGVRRHTIASSDALCLQTHNSLTSTHQPVSYFRTMLTCMCAACALCTNHASLARATTDECRRLASVEKTVTDQPPTSTTADALRAASTHTPSPFIYLRSLLVVYHFVFLIHFQSVDDAALAPATTPTLAVTTSHTLKFRF